VIDAVAVAELTSQQDGVVRQQLIKHLLNAEQCCVHFSYASRGLSRRVGETDLGGTSRLLAHPRNVDGAILLARQYERHSAHEAGYEPRQRFSWDAPLIAAATLNEDRMLSSVPRLHKF
jgi:hypothetical protein